jgi:hypothetical protein
MNIMVKTDSNLGFKLVDFDWSGRIGMVQYPMNMNQSDSLWRPEGAQDGEFIAAKHDIKMLDCMRFQDRFIVIL